MLFRDPGFADKFFGGDAVALSGADAAREAATNVRLLNLEVVNARTSEALNSGLTSDDVDDAIDVSAQDNSDVVEVRATDEDPDNARKIANRFAMQFVQFRAEADRRRLRSAQRLAQRRLRALSADERSGARGEQLGRAAQRLGILASLQGGNAELVQPAVTPESPSSPKPLRNAVFGFVLGLVAGAALALVLERLNRVLREPEEVEAAFDLPLLGAVPESKAMRCPSSLSESAEQGQLPFAEQESLRLLRASLRYFDVEKEVKTLLVTSDLPGVGKSSVAWNLAHVAAQAEKVVFLEADLRKPAFLGDTGPGLAQVLAHQASLDEASLEVPLARKAVNSNGREDHRLCVVPAGAIPPNPAELTGSKGMASVIEALSDAFDLVIIDAAPIGVLADAYPLIGRADGVLAVARIGVTTRKSATGLAEKLKRLDAPTLGVVANSVKIGRNRYGYGYGYAQDSRGEKVRRES